VRDKIILLAIGLAAGLPTLANAQVSEADRRMFEVQQAAREAELRQRVDQLERTVENQDLRLRTDQNLRNMQTATQVPGPVYPQVQSTVPLLSGPRRALTQDEIQAAELAASNARLKALSQPPAK
jgi:hypothetical protein